MDFLAVTGHPGGYGSVRFGRSAPGLFRVGSLSAWMARVSIDFLTAVPRRLPPSRPVNVLQILGRYGSEDAADAVLAYFLDPAERHGLDVALMDALLTELDGSWCVDAGGITDRVFQAGAFLGSSDWQVQRQVMARGDAFSESQVGWDGRIDLFLTNPTLDIAIIIENKIGAPLHNPLESYVRRAADWQYGTVLLTVLAPEMVTPSERQARWISKAITYRGLFGRLDDARDADDGLSDDTPVDVRRSKDLLEQFREMVERDPMTHDHSSDAAYLTNFRSALVPHANEVADFFDSVKRVNTLVRDRRKRLEPLIRERLDARSIDTSGWEAQGHNTDRWVYTWNAYLLSSVNASIELNMSADPARPELITVKAYPGRSYKYFPGWEERPLGVGWEASDQEIADAFLAAVQELIVCLPDVQD